MATHTIALTRAKHYQQVSALYTDIGWDRLKRHYKYIRTPNKESGNSMTVALTCISSFAFLGAKTGKMLGTEFEKSCAAPQKLDTGIRN